MQTTFPPTPVTQLIPQTLMSSPSSSDQLTPDVNAILAKADAFIATNETYSTTFRLVMSSLYSIGAFDKASQVLAAVEARDVNWQDTCRRLKVKYGLADDVSSRELGDIASTEEKLAFCKDCDGSNCKRPQLKWFDYDINIVDGHPHIIEYACCSKVKQFAKKQKIKKLFADSQIPLEFQHMSFDDFVVNDGNKTAYERAKQIVDDGKDGIIGLYLYGNTGVGKTMLASIIANEAVKQGRAVIFDSVSTLLRRIRSTFDRNVRSESFNGDTKVVETKNNFDALMTSIETVDLLVLDDLGQEKNSLWVADTITSILDERKKRELPTIFISNLDIKQLEAHFAFSRIDTDKSAIADLQNAACRIVSRIFAMCDSAQIIGHDWRRHNI